jgi:hypothetical protein
MCKRADGLERAQQVGRAFLPLERDIMGFEDDVRSFMSEVRDRLDNIEKRLDSVEKRLDGHDKSIMNVYAARPHRCLRCLHQSNCVLSRSRAGERAVPRPVCSQGHCRHPADGSGLVA